MYIYICICIYIYTYIIHTWVQVPLQYIRTSQSQNMVAPFEAKYIPHTFEKASAQERLVLGKVAWWGKGERRSCFFFFFFRSSLPLSSGCPRLSSPSTPAAITTHNEESRRPPAGSRASFLCCRFWRIQKNVLRLQVYKPISGNYFSIAYK